MIPGDPISLWERQIAQSVRHLLSQEDRDPYSPTSGCFDRRYWAWKLTDYAEATYQRSVYPLVWWARRPGRGQDEVAVLTAAACAGLNFATRIQHRTGAFDQAFPNEHSFGATAFLVHPLLVSYQHVREACAAEMRSRIDDCLHRGADFLCRHEETHGHIANHLAGAVLSLLVCAKFFDEERYHQRAIELLDRILVAQSREGWFREYEGADPGYQTLCLHYLAQVYRLHREVRLREALERAIHFLSWFVHPDGTYGGEYGSRRTAVFYPGGFALLTQEFPMAGSIMRAMLRSVESGSTTGLSDVDMGNLVPLLSSYVTLADAGVPVSLSDAPSLPWEQGNCDRDFTEAGIHVRQTPRYYAIVGSSNGGVMKVFDSKKRILIWNDGGYVGQTVSGTFITTQITDPSRRCRVGFSEIEVQSHFCVMSQAVQSPWKLVLLRLLNLTVMRSPLVGNWIKQHLVALLITAKRRFPLCLTRVCHFEAERVVVRDVLFAENPVVLRWLEFGRPFVAIHMASAKYFENYGSSLTAISGRNLETKALRTGGQLMAETVIEPDQRELERGGKGS